MLSLLVVEDHALVREGLVQTLGQLDSSVTVHEAADSDAASALLEGGLAVDLMALTHRPCLFWRQAKLKGNAINA